MGRNLSFFSLAAFLSIAIIATLPKLRADANQTDLPHPVYGDQFSQSITVTETEITMPRYKTTGSSKAFRVEDFRVLPGSTVFQTLASNGVAPKDILEIIAAAKPIKNLASIAAKTMISVAWLTEQDTDPHRIEFVLSATKSLVVEKDKEQSDWGAKVEEAEIEVIPTSFSGIVTNNLWDSAMSAGMDPSVIHKLAEVMAWQVDFNRGVQFGDRWRLSVERHFADGEPVGWGEIIVADYENVGVVTTAVRFKHNGLKRQYFSPDGNSLRRLFLKSPLRFGRVTSGFGFRFHPILKKRKRHLGVDYGAPTGTPVMAVGNGVVEYASRRGGSGKTVKIRHNSVYHTAYKHLSRYAKGIKSGTRVEMGQTIGYVGSTGLATGPHLHFEFYKHGRYVDPMGLKFPSADPVPERLMDEFNLAAQKALLLLPEWKLTEDQKIVADATQVDANMVKEVTPAESKEDSTSETP